MAWIEINTDGLAKLGEIISYGFGLTASGRRKMADAESYAAAVQAETSTQIALIKLKGEEEVANYVLAREARKMANAKSVVEKAQSHFAEEGPISAEPVNIGWVNRFFSIVEDISDETLHDMWGSILAGEVKRPNSYSLRTLELLKNVTQEEAELFVKASRFRFADNSICTENFALSLNETLLLAEIGFINSEELAKNWTVEPMNKKGVAIDINTALLFHNNTSQKISCSISVKKLTTVGIEILSLIEKSNRDEFCEYLAKFFKSRGGDRVFKHAIERYRYDNNTFTYEDVGEEIVVS